MKLLLTLCLVAIATFGLQARAQDAKDVDEPESTALLGTYEIVSGERGGEKLPPDHFQGVTVSIAANAITTLDKDKKEVYAATYSLDTSKSPWKIMMTAKISTDGSKGTKAAGLIQRTGETVKLIYALPEGKPPTEFKTDDHQQMFVMKRIGKVGAKAQ